MAKKTNPRRVPATQADVFKARQFGTRYAVTLMFYTLYSRMGLDAEWLCKMWEQYNDVCNSIIKGYTKFDEIADVLRDEINIEVRD